VPSEICPVYRESISPRRRSSRSAEGQFARPVRRQQPRTTRAPRQRAYHRLGAVREQAQVLRVAVLKTKRIDPVPFSVAANRCVIPSSASSREQPVRLHRQHHQHDHVRATSLTFRSTRRTGLDHADERPRPASGQVPKRDHARDAFRPMSHVACTKVSAPAAARQRRHRGADRPDEAVEPPHRDAHVVAALVLRGRLHRHADAAVAENVQQRRRTRCGVIARCSRR